MTMLKTITIASNLRYVHWTWLHHVSFPLALTVSSVKPKPSRQDRRMGFPPGKSECYYHKYVRWMLWAKTKSTDFSQKKIDKTS